MTICDVADKAQPGYMPRQQAKPKIRIPYAEQRLGLNRYYMGQQNQVEIERVIRVQNAGNINPQDIAVTEDGEQYRIDLAQRVMGVYPPSVDLTLSRVAQKYEVENAMV